MGDPSGGGTALTVIGADKALERVEGVAASMAAKSKASVEARYVVAMRNPRSWMQMRTKLLEACKRPGFAAGALWKKPIGDKTLTGPSIRMAEEMARCAGNLLIETTVVHDGEDRQVVCVTVTDLEANLAYPLEMSLEKTVERQKITDRAEGSVISVRTNSYGKKVYTVRATEDEMAVKRAAWASKLIRVNVLRIVPGDIQEEAIAMVKATINDEDRKDPQAAAKRVADAYIEIGVEPLQLEEYLGHPLSRITELELADLRAIYTALQEKESTWGEIMDLRAQHQANAKGPATATATVADVTKPEPGTTRTGKLAAELKRQKEGREPGEEG